MKAIVIGASLSGKTTLVKFLRSKTKEEVSEMDQELTDINKGSFPKTKELKQKLGRKVIKKVLGLDSIIFFSNADYFTEQNLLDARKKGFKVILLNLSLDQLKKRNTVRVKDEGCEDMAPWLIGMIDYQRRMKDKRLVDAVVDADMPVAKLAKDLLGKLE